MATSPDERPTWSRSQVGALRECRRKFLLGQRFATPAPSQAAAESLKKLKNRHLWAGGLLHDTLGSLLKTVRQGEALPSDDVIVNAARERMRAEFRGSKAAASTGQAGADVRLFEHAYDVAVPPAVWQGHWESVERGLRWFLKSKWLERLRALGPECWKAVDEVLDFDVDGIKAYVKIDCAIETGGRFILIDWKTGPLRAGDEKGLLVAALYAHEVWGADAESLDAYAVSVADGRSAKAALDEEAFMETFMRIQEESAALAQERAAAGADPMAVPRPEDLSVCARCSFQKICHPAGLQARLATGAG